MMRRSEDRALRSLMAQKLKEAKRETKGMKYVYPELDRHLKLRVYFKHPLFFEGRKVAMESPVGTPASLREHADLLEGKRATAGAPAKRQAIVHECVVSPQPFTLGWLVERYLRTVEFRSLKPTTQQVRRKILSHIVAEVHPKLSHLQFRDCPLNQFDSDWVKELRDRRIIWKRVSDTDDDDEGLIRTNTEGANSWVKALRAVFGWAADQRDTGVKINWARDVRLFPSSSEGWHTWTLEEIAQYRKVHKVGTKARLALELFLYTLQRRSDAVRIGNSVLRTDTKGRSMFIFPQQKTGATAYIPFLPELQRVIAETPCAGSEFFVCQDNGKPYTKESLGNMMREWCDAAELPNCSAHGLRKAGVVELIRLRCTHHQIMSLSGHGTLKEIDRYAREFARQNAAEQVLDEWLSRDSAGGAAILD